MCSTEKNLERQTRLEKELGLKIVQLLDLKPIKKSRNTYENKFKTAYGDKTYLGLGRTIINEIENTLKLKL